jgi:hypothetical protein
MSKQQAILETLLGAAELNGNRTIAERIRADIEKMSRKSRVNQYEHLALAASETKHDRRQAA